METERAGLANVAARGGARGKVAWAVLALTSLVVLGDLLLLSANLQHAPAGGDTAGNPSYLPAFRVERPVFSLGFVALGVLIVSRQATNAVGWIFVAFGAQSVVAAALLEYVELSRNRSIPLPGASTAAIFAGGVGKYAFLAAISFIVFLFPDGRFASRLWRGVGWLAAGLLLLGAGAQVVATPAALDDGGLRRLGGVAILVVTLGPPLAAVISLINRYRRSGSDQRHQIKWLLYASGVVLVGGVLIPGVTQVLPGTSRAFGSSLIAVGVSTVVLIPIAAAVAILRYRLYDIDVVISRTLVYGALAAFITAVYVVIVVGIGSLFGSGGTPNPVLSIAATAVVAVAFEPVRERLQTLANRLVYGTRATPYEVLSAFSERVAESYAADDVLPRMARVLAEGTGSDSATVWLRSGDELRAAAAYPDHERRPESIPVSAELLRANEPGDRAVPVRHQGELLGALSVHKRAGEALTPIEETLLADLAKQAGLVLRNVGLTAELLARLDELRGSRQRLVAAQDQERRRLERNLHDGAQQHLVALKVKLGLAEMLVTTNAERARALVGELKDDADEALETLRDLARGIYPPLLADRGLVAALEAQARRATISVEVRAEAITRYPQEIEAAMYFCCLEALQNIQKYAGATRALVRLSATGGQLRVAVEDDGRGFDPVGQARGTGLQNMADRMASLGGTLEIKSRPGSGTVVTVAAPSGASMGSAEVLAGR